MTRLAGSRDLRCREDHAYLLESYCPCQTPWASLAGQGGNACCPGSIPDASSFMAVLADLRATGYPHRPVVKEGNQGLGQSSPTAVAGAQCPGNSFPNCVHKKQDLRFRSPVPVSSDILQSE